MAARASSIVCLLVNQEFALVGLADKFEESVSQRCHYHYAFLTDCEGIQRSGGDRSSRVLEVKLNSVKMNVGLRVLGLSILHLG